MAAARPAPRREALWVALLLALHAALAIWGAARNSVTFDENLHLPAGVMIASRGELRASAVNPPLLKALCGAAALAAGARLPSPAALEDGEHSVVGESFMRINARRYHHVYFAARLVVATLSLVLACLVWRYARRLYGPRAALLALALYATAPEALAHAGVATMDLTTGLGWLATIYCFWGFARSGRWSWWLRLALALSFCLLVRFSGLLLVPTLLLLAILFGQRMARRPGRMWLGLALLGPFTLATINLGYLGRTSLEPLSQGEYESRSFQRLQRALPGLRLPLPDAYLGGLDRQAVESQAGVTTTFLLGKIHTGPVWYYFPLALLFKWPLGFLGLLAARGFRTWRERPSPRRHRHEAFLLVPAGLFLATAMFANLNIGVRYLFPILPFLCVWCGGMRPRSGQPGRSRRPVIRRWAAVALLLLAVQAVETMSAAPWYLAFFNWPAGGPGGGYRLVNDSNVDWGQGLIALKAEMQRRGISRVHLAYHGTADPAVYGIDYIPYITGAPGPESDWLAVSSYYFVGLSQRMMTQHGRTDFLRYDFRPLWGTPPVATPAGCMMLFRVR